MQKIKLMVVPVTPFQQNCSILICAKSNSAALIDPGGDQERIEEAIESSGAAIKKILITHGHIDHIGATAALAEKLGCPIEGPHIGDKSWIDTVASIAERYGFPQTKSFTPTRWLSDGDVVEVGELTFDVLHCPGHSEGSVVFLLQTPDDEAKLAIVGDVLFQGSVGRTDLPGGNHETLINSIKTKLLPLPDSTAFLCGHGPMSTIGEERLNNPFLQEA